MFINLVLRKEQEVYRSEGVEWVHVEFQDNEPIYRMVEVRYMYVNCVSSDVQWNLLIYSGHTVKQLTTSLLQPLVLKCHPCKV